ncbi:hypothetical protein U1Q18_038032, partial [Sarracenia purpurea var. burkii]
TRIAEASRWTQAVLRDSDSHEMSLDGYTLGSESARRTDWEMQNIEIGIALVIPVVPR